MQDKRMMDKCKCVYHHDRITEHYDKGERIAPVHLDIGIAKFCNVSCIFCFGFSQSPSKTYIQRGPLLQTMRDAGEIGVKSIGIIGDGEGTCNPFCYEALREGHNAGVDMAISTNGVDLDSQGKLEAVLESCKWMRVCFSAGTKEGYHRIHRRDYFDKVVSHIKNLVALKENRGYKCDIGMQAVFVPTVMKDEIIAEGKLAAELGVDYLIVKQCSLPDEGQTGMMQFDLNIYDRPEIQDALAQCESYGNDKTDIVIKRLAMARKGRREYEHCPAVPMISEMSGDGSWFPCGVMFGDKPQFDYLKFGNVHDQTLKEIWESDRYHDICEYMKYGFDSENDCKGCCRLDPANKYIHEYCDKPMGINFL